MQLFLQLAFCLSRPSSKKFTALLTTLALLFPVLMGLTPPGPPGVTTSSHGELLNLFFLNDLDIIARATCTYLVISTTIILTFLSSCGLRCSANCMW